jgi:riboflavin kinase/FMN adenylyltransferase
MQIHWSLQDLHLQDVWLTIGSFDGVHRGHQAIVQKLTAGAHTAGAPAVVITFHPHPAVVLRGKQGPYYLTSPEERAALLGELGVDIVVIHPFNHEVANLSAREFVSRLHTHLGLKRLCVGHDFALGHNREGNLLTLESLGEEFGYQLEVISPISFSDQEVSSSQIRSSLMQGDVEQAALLLGRPYEVNGPVVHGDGRGKQLGIPTANLDVWPERLLPKAGVYACLAKVGERELHAVANVGVRPTFTAAPAPVVEAHLLDFKADVYQQEISLSFIARLRDEQRFSGIPALVAQIQQDIQCTREILESKA